MLSKKKLEKIIQALRNHGYFLPVEEEGRLYVTIYRQKGFLFWKKKDRVGIIDNYAGRIELDLEAGSYADKIRKILINEKICGVKVWTKKW